MDSRPTIAFPASLASVEVLDDRGLRIVLEERTGLVLKGDPDGPGVQRRERTSLNTDRNFEIIWEVVVCFAVRGDPFPKGETSSASITEASAPSAFLSWVQSQSYAEPDYVSAMYGASDPDPNRYLRHWVVASLEAHFDVAAIDPPTVREIASP